MKDRTIESLDVALRALAYLMFWGALLWGAHDCGQQWRQLRADAHKCSLSSPGENP